MLTLLQKFDWIHLWSHLLLDVCLFWEEFFHSVSISILVVCLFILSISSWFSLGRLYLSKNLFLLGCSVYWHIVPCGVSHNPLYFCDASCKFSFFISNFIDLSPLPFFLMNLAKDLSILFTFSKNQLLGSLIFVIVLFVSISVISALVFMISFLLITLNFNCLSSCFGC